MKVEIIEYSEEYRYNLESLMIDCSTELFGSGTADVDSFVDRHQYIYLAVFGDDIVGFSSFLINDYFGMREPTLGNTYIYVKPKFRNTRAMYLFSIQTAILSKELEIDIEHYYENEVSSELGYKWFCDGKKLYTVFLYNSDEVTQVGKRLAEKLNIRGVL